MSQRIFKKNRTSNIAASIILVLLSILIWWQSDSFPGLEEGYPGPNLFPRIIALGLGGIGLLLGYSYFIASPPKSNIELKFESKGIFKPALAILLVASFPIISPMIGFTLTLLMITILMGFVFQLEWKNAILTALITVGVIYLIFSQLLSVIL